jgi:hypothetical protein
LMVTPTAYYLEHRAVQEWMIYRFIVSHLAGTLASLLLSASHLTGRIVAIVLPKDLSKRRQRNVLEWFFSSRLRWYTPTMLLIGGGLLVLPSFLELVRTGATYEHWSRFIAMSFCWSVAFIILVTSVVDYILGLLGAQLTHHANMSE